jgi:dihydroxy-acid dehydratase
MTTEKPYTPDTKDTGRLRSQAWFDDRSNPDMTALYIERYLNYGLTRQELQSGKPIIGIAQTGSDLAPCNRHHIELASRVRDGIREAGGVPIEFPVHPIQETGKRPTAALDRNLSYLGLVEVLYGPAWSPPSSTRTSSTPAECRGIPTSRKARTPQRLRP